MKKIIFILMILALSASAQFVHTIDYGKINYPVLTKTFQVTSGSASVKDVDSIWVQLPSRYASAAIDTFANKATPVSAGFTAGRQTVWDGNCQLDFVLTNTSSLATDSLVVKVYGIDLDGNILYNNYCWASFVTPPAYVTSANILAWTSAVRYRANLTGAFGIGTGGLLITVDVNDGTATHYGSMILRVYL